MGPVICIGEEVLSVTSLVVGMTACNDAPMTTSLELLLRFVERQVNDMGDLSRTNFMNSTLCIAMNRDSGWKPAMRVHSTMGNPRCTTIVGYLTQD